MMNIRQVFRSIRNEQTISKFEIVWATSRGSDTSRRRHCSLNRQRQPYTAGVQSRLISYVTKKMSVGRDDDCEIIITLTVDLSN